MTIHPRDLAAFAAALTLGLLAGAAAGIACGTRWAHTDDIPRPGQP